MVRFVPALVAACSLSMVFLAALPAPVSAQTFQQKTCTVETVVPPFGYPCGGPWTAGCARAACEYEVTCEVAAAAGLVGCSIYSWSSEPLQQEAPTTWTDCVDVVPLAPAGVTPTQPSCTRQAALSFAAGTAFNYACYPRAMYASGVTTTCTLTNGRGGLRLDGLSLRCEGSLAVHGDGTAHAVEQAAPPCAGTERLRCRTAAGCEYTLACGASASLGATSCKAEVAWATGSAQVESEMVAGAKSASEDVVVPFGKTDVALACEVFTQATGAILYVLECNLLPKAPASPSSLPHSKACGSPFGIRTTFPVGVAVNSGSTCTSEYLCSDPSGSCSLEVTCSVVATGNVDCLVSASVLDGGHWHPTEATTVQTSCPAAGAPASCSRTALVTVPNGRLLQYDCQAGGVSLGPSITCTLDAANGPQPPLESNACLALLYTLPLTSVALVSINGVAVGVNPPCSDTFYAQCPAGATSCTYNVTCEVRAAVGNVGCGIHAQSQFGPVSVATTSTDCQSASVPVQAPQQPECRHSATLTVPAYWFTYECRPVAVVALAVETTCSLYP